LKLQFKCQDCRRSLEYRILHHLPQTPDCKGFATGRAIEFWKGQLDYNFFLPSAFLDASPITNCMFRHENAEQLVFLLYLYFHFVKIGQFTVRFASQNFPSSIINRSMTEIREHVKWFLFSINTFKLFIGLFFENI
jgi:hypothetical protein